MKKIYLAVLSLAALAFGRAEGFCTANTQAEDIAALQEQLAQQKEELELLRAAQTVPVPPAENLGTLDLLMKGAGVEREDVLWRVKAGLEPHQAVEVAAAEKAERAAAKKK